MRAVLTLALLLPACLLFEDASNEAPTLEIANPGPIYRNAPIRLRAQVADDRDPAQRLRVEWALFDGACPATPHASLASVPAAKERSDGAEATFPAPTLLTPFCVRATVTDSSGAQAHSSRSLTPVNRPPLATLSEMAAMARGDLSPSTLTPAGPRQLFRIVEVATLQDPDPDGDKVSWRFRVIGPDDSPVETTSCPGMRGNESRRCFVPMRPGLYRATVEITDPWTSVGSEPLVISVAEDAPPCLDRSEPALETPLVLLRRDERRYFNVIRVDDDGDPYPRGDFGEATFVWSVGTGAGSLQRLAGPSSSRQQIAGDIFADLRPGDRFRVRVEPRDRIADQQARSRLAASPVACRDDQDVCRVGACVRWATWHVQVQP